MPMAKCYQVVRRVGIHPGRWVGTGLRALASKSAPGFKSKNIKRLVLIDGFGEGVRVCVEIDKTVTPRELCLNGTAPPQRYLGPVLLP